MLILLPTVLKMVQVSFECSLLCRLSEESERLVVEEDVEFDAPISLPDKVVCVGLNYASHCTEQGLPFPEYPVFFNKFPSTIIGPSQSVIHPPNTKVIKLLDL